ncbi:FADL212Wp [Eremothecium gossypii FDAG1]|nr:FADL212Wp [Eremothecium gossypii FDAG1]
MTETFTAVFEDLVEPRPIEHLGQSDLSYQGQLDPPLKIHEDGGESGCGGKVWIAGNLLCEFILEKSKDGRVLSQFPGYERQFKNIIELGSGTGLVGLCVGLHGKYNGATDTNVYITDTEGLCPLMQKNVELNGLDGMVHPRPLFWGEPLSDEFTRQPIDLVLAADCVYLEKAFPLLEKTLLDLTAGESQPLVLMSYKKRRKADKKFFIKIKKEFDIIEIKDFKSYEDYRRQRTYLFQLVRKPARAPHALAP